MSDNLPWKTWTPDDLAPPQAEFVPIVEPEETIIEEAEPSLEQQLAQLQMQAHEQGYQAGIAEGHAAKVMQKRVEKHARSWIRKLVIASVRKNVVVMRRAAAQRAETPRQAAKARTHQKIHVLAVKPLFHWA